MSQENSFNRRRLLQALAASTLPLSGVAPSLAQAAWPDRPIKFIVPFGAGSGTDIVARLVGQKLSEAVGQPVVVENKVGASGSIAAEFMTRAAPDGYTVFIATQTTQASNAGMFKKLPYDPLKSFEPVTMLGSIPLLIVVTPSLPVTNVQELMAYARANPGKLTVGYGTGGAQVTAELFKTLAKAEVLLVPYKSNPLALTAVMAGEINMMVTDPGPSLQLIAAGKLRALAVTTPQRSSIAPNLPTAIEAGLPGYDLSAWYCALLPAGTPKPIVTRLHDELARIVAMPDVKQRFGQAGIEAFSSTPEQLQKFMESELVKWSTHIKNAGMIPE
ncbi:MAG: tripartite tricarboxylate transporter substrate binding protein [Burkholderiaceae bacterium]